LEFNRLSEDSGNVLDEKVFVELASVNSFVFKKNTLFIFNRGVSKVQVKEAWDDDQEDEKGAEQHWDMVVCLEKEMGEGNSDIVATRAVGVAILLKVIVCGFIGQNLLKKQEQSLSKLVNTREMA